jgi:hypothetical protein
MNTQVREYTEFFQGTIDPVDMEEILHQRVGDGPVRPVGPVRSTHRRGWVTAAVAAMVTVIVLGSVAWLSRPDGDAPPADETPQTTTVVTPTTEAAITTDTVAATTTTLVVAPIVPPGEGPKLSFVEATPPTVDLSGGVWFNGALYAIGDAGDSGRLTLHRSTDGIIWEMVPRSPAGGGGRRMLQTDGDRLVDVVVPESGTFIEVFTSRDGDDWASSIVQPPMPIGSNMAGEFALVDASNTNSVNVAVGSEGIILTATVTLSFEGESFANGLVDADEGIHVEIVDLDVERGVMIVKFLDEDNDMAQIGDIREIDLSSAGFSGAFSNLLDAMATDPDWDLQIERFVGQLTGMYTVGFASASVAYAWHSRDGINWQRIDTPGPGRDSEIWALTDPPNRVFEDIPTVGMQIEIGDLGVIGTPTHDYTQGPGVTGEIEVLLSVDGTSWNRWEPSEFGENPGWARVSIVGIGDDFVVIQIYTWDAFRENASRSIWVGTIP